ncbi:14663_t:CDS:1, partial [Acaulospora colombiana]
KATLLGNDIAFGEGTVIFALALMTLSFKPIPRNGHIRPIFGNLINC